MRTLRLMADFGSYPVWESFDDGGLDNLDHKDLPISDELKCDLTSWEEHYQGTFNEEYPPDSGFSTETEEQTFYREGRMLWQRLRHELGSAFYLEPYKSYQVEANEEVTV